MTTMLTALRGISSTPTISSEWLWIAEETFHLSILLTVSKQNSENAKMYFQDIKSTAGNSLRKWQLVEIMLGYIKMQIGYTP